MPLLDLASLRDALSSLSEGLDSAERHPDDDVRRDGVVKRFAFAHDISLHLIRRVLELYVGDDVDTMPYHAVLQNAAHYELIDDVMRWATHRVARMKSLQLHDRAIAADVYSQARPFLRDARYLLARLESRVADAASIG